MTLLDNIDKLQKKRNYDLGLHESATSEDTLREILFCDINTDQSENCNNLSTSIYGIDFSNLIYQFISTYKKNIFIPQRNILH